MANEAIKTRLRVENIPRWMIAEELNVCEMTIIRWLRTDLTEEQYNKIDSAITKIANNRKKQEE